MALASLLAAGSIEAPEWAIPWVEIELKYGGYIERERLGAERLGRMDDFRLAPELPYQSFHSVSYEAREKLIRIRPATLGQASRIPGLSPSDLQGLVMEVLRWRPEVEIEAAID